MGLDLESRLDFARRAALEAEQIIMSHYQRGVQVERKRDSTPVTVADRSAELAIRAGIEREFPNDAILGEEFGERPGSSGFRWVLDPEERGGRLGFGCGKQLTGIELCVLCVLRV